MTLPGDHSLPNKIDEILRVNHAGEYGALRIYQGQLAVLGKDEGAPTLRHMAEQEKVHLARFETLIPQRRARPTALLPLWHVAGFALGAGTALLGRKAAMACTVAVETVIVEHYQSQLDELGDEEAELKETIRTFRAEEMEHHDLGIDQEAEQAPFYGLLTGAIKAGCRLAIWTAKRV